MRLPSIVPHHPDVQKHFLVRVGVPQADQRTGCGDDDAYFFVQLTGERGAALLAVLELPAGNLPGTGHMRACRALRDQYASCRVDDRSRDYVHRLECCQPLACCKVPWQCLYLRPEPQGHGSLRPTFGMARTKGTATGRGSTSLTIPPAAPGGPAGRSA